MDCLFRFLGDLPIDDRANALRHGREREGRRLH
jgi:hypothetical protein